DRRAMAQGSANGVEQRTQDAGTHPVEPVPQFFLIHASAVVNRGQGQENGPIQQIGARCQILNAVDKNGPGGVEQLLLVVGVQFACAEATAGRQAAQGVRQVRLDAGQVVESDDPSIGCCNHQVSVVAGRLAQR